MLKRYFGFAIADSMFEKVSFLVRMATTPEKVNQISDELTSICNPSHKPTIDAMTKRFGIKVAIPEKPPQITLQEGDEVYVMSVRGLPRMEGKHEYNQEDIDKATFTFSRWIVLPNEGVFRELTKAEGYEISTVEKAVEEILE